MRNRSARPVKSSDFPAGFRSTIGSSPEDALIFLNYRSILGSWERALELRVLWFQIVRFGLKADMATSPSYWFVFFGLRFGLSETPSAPFTPPVTPPTVPPTTVPTAPPTGPAALLPSRAPWLAPCCAPPTTPWAFAMSGIARPPRIATRINVAFIYILLSENL